MMEKFVLKSGRYTLDEIKTSGENTVEGKCAQSSCESSSSSFPIALVFDKGKISHPADTQVTVHLKGTIFLSLNQGQYPRIPAYDTSKFDAILKNWAIEHYVVDHNASSELEKLSLYPASDFFYLVPNLKPWNAKSNTFFKAFFHHSIVDRFLANSVTTAIPLLTKEHFNDMIKFVSNIFTEMYRFPDCIPNFDIPFLNTILKGWFIIYEELKANVAGYEKYHVHFLKEILNWIQVHKCAALYMGTDWQPNGDSFIILRKMAGRRALVELLQLITATYVDDYIRNHVLFEMFIESADLIHNLTYDIFNFSRVYESKKNERNSLWVTMKHMGIPFEQALNHQLNAINNEVINFRVIAKALSTEFPGSEALEKYIENTMLFVDGAIRHMVNQERYGTCKYKIMKLTKIPFAQQKNKNSFSTDT